MFPSTGALRPCTCGSHCLTRRPRRAEERESSQSSEEEPSVPRCRQHAPCHAGHQSERNEWSRQQELQPPLTMALHPRGAELPGVPVPLPEHRTEWYRTDQAGACDP